LLGFGWRSETNAEFQLNRFLQRIAFKVALSCSDKDVVHAAFVWNGKTHAFVREEASVDAKAEQTIEIKAPAEESSLTTLITTKFGVDARREAEDAERAKHRAAEDAALAEARAAEDKDIARHRAAEDDEFARHSATSSSSSPTTVR
jgi:hypothetical protein